MAEAARPAPPPQAGAPDPFAAGGRRWREVRAGMMLGLIDLELNEPFVYNSHTFPALCLSVVLEGLATNNIQGVEGGFCPDEVWISAIGERVPTSMTILPGQPVRVVELILTPDWVRDNRPAMGRDAAFRMMARAMRRPLAIHRRPLDARLRQLAWSALNPPLSGAFADVHLDACALSLLGVLAEHFQAGAARPATGMLTARALRRMLAVRRFIDADPAAVASIAALAARFATSQSALKQDFHKAFGVSARDYWFERRMLVGRNAILRDRLSIAEAAYKAGYEHPANFTTAFRRYFGYPPSTLKS